MLRTGTLKIWHIVLFTVTICVVIVAVFDSDLLPIDLVPILSLLGILAVVIWGYLRIARSLIPWTTRQAIERLIIGEIATVVRQNLPLATGLSLSAQSESGAARRYLGQMADLLGQGATLSEALGRGFPHCSALSLSLIAAGERAGQLPLAVTQVEQMLVDRTKHLDDRASIWPYVLCVGSMMVLMISGMMVAVVPKFKCIFADFETELPLSTRILIEISEEFASFSFLLIPIALLIPVGIYMRMRPRRMPKLAPASVLADRIRWTLPWVGRLEFARGMNVVLKTMLLGVRSGMGLAPSAELASRVDVNARLRPRLAQFAELLDKGTPLREAAKRASLGKVTCVAMASGERSGDMAGALNYAADYYGAIGSRLLIVIRNLSWPVMTLVMAIVVGFVVVAMFEPLIALIDSVSTTVE